MSKLLPTCLAGVVAAALAHPAAAGTDVFFNPLTQSAAVAIANHVNELNSPWLAPPGLRQVNLTSLSEAEADVNQSIVRVPGTGNQASMFDMLARIVRIRRPLCRRRNRSGRVEIGRMTADRGRHRGGAGPTARRSGP
ncbi:MAG TPA: hypothetical protein VF200_00805 [Woeseiaceae bacterium]